MQQAQLHLSLALNITLKPGQNVGAHIWKHWKGNNSRQIRNEQQALKYDWFCIEFSISLPLVSPNLKSTQPETWKWSQREGASGEGLYLWLQDWEKELPMFRWSVDMFPSNPSLLPLVSFVPGPKQSSGGGGGGSYSDWNQQEWKLWERELCFMLQFQESKTNSNCFVLCHCVSLSVLFHSRHHMSLISKVQNTACQCEVIRSLKQETKHNGSREQKSARKIAGNGNPEKRRCKCDYELQGLLPSYTYKDQILTNIGFYL